MASAESIDPSLRDATFALIDKLSAQLPGQRHEIALSALITLFRRAALQFTCCTESSGHHCIALVHELLNSTAANQREPGTPVH